MITDKQKLSEGILFTDFYQLTMAQLYYYSGLHEREAQFDYFFRKYPSYNGHSAGYCINAGLEDLLNWMRRAAFGEEEIEYLGKQTGRSGEPLFKREFLGWLKENGNFDQITMKAIPEGRVVHPNVPVVVVQGPLAMAQILESPLLNNLNYQTLIATKASRIKEAGVGRMLIEFGMRRGQGKGANAGARGALIGGADFTSNTGISYSLGYPPKGTHAHSMVQAFMALGEGELGAFRAYADMYPDDCLLLVDTIDTLKSGVPNAIKVFQELRKKGHKPFGIRLDSGDLAYLSIQSAKMLNDAGFEDAVIILSNKLDEMVIWQIINQIRKDAPGSGVDPESLINRLVYGVGTKLITSKGYPALDGVYKLAAIKKDKVWTPAIKLSETQVKTINPGFKHIWRIYDKKNKAIADLLSLKGKEIFKEEEILLYHPTDVNISRRISRSEISGIEPLLKNVLEEGELVYDLPSIKSMRELRDKDTDRLYSGVKRLINPHSYHVSLSEELWKLKQELIHSFRSTF